MKKNILLFGIVLFILAISLTYVNSTIDTDVEDSKKIMVTNYAVELLTKEIVGDNYIVENIYEPNSDIHNSEISAIKTKEIVDSDIVIYISSENDSEVENLAKSDLDNTQYVNITSSAIFKENVSPNLYNENGVIVNEHIWLSPKKLLVVSDLITNILVQSDPQNASEYEGNSLVVEKRLKEIDNEYKQFSDNQTYPLIMTHDAYFYLNYDYGIEYYALYGEHHDDEPSTNKIKEIIDLVNEEKIPYIYVEQDDLENDLIIQIAQETGAQVKQINTLETESTKEEYSNMSIYDILQYNLNAMKG